MNYHSLMVIHTTTPLLCLQVLITPIVVAVLRALPRGLRLRLQPPLAHKPLGEEQGEEGPYDPLATGPMVEGDKRRVKARRRKGSGRAVCEASPVEEASRESKSVREAQRGGAGCFHPTEVSASVSASFPSAAHQLNPLRITADRRAQPSSPESPRQMEGVTGWARADPRDRGLALRPDGFPCDADAIRRYLVYCVVVMSVVAWHNAALSWGLVGS